jgi:hypothetical protein
MPDDWQFRLLQMGEKDTLTSKFKIKELIDEN